jgi:hypothetical protein
MSLAASQESGGLVFVLNARNIWKYTLAAFAPHDSHEKRDRTPVISSKFRLLQQHKTPILHANPPPNSQP